MDWLASKFAWSYPFVTLASFPPSYGSPHLARTAAAAANTLRQMQPDSARPAHYIPRCCAACDPAPNISTASSGYANMPNSGTSSPDNSTSRVTRIERHAFSSENTTYVNPSAYTASSVAPPSCTYNCLKSPCSNPVTPCPAFPRYAAAPTPFHPAPYVPSAKIPTATAPNHPQYPCTEIAPHGSSIFSTRSLKSTPKQTNTPAITPITTDEVGVTNAHGAVIATRPASIPLQAIVMSGLPNMKYHSSIAAADPATAARFVFTATTEMRKSVAPNVEPGLNPIHPNNKINVPLTTKTIFEAGNARGFPSAPYFPSRGPKIIANAIAQNPPIECTTDDPATSTYPRPQRMLAPSCESQPPPQAKHPEIEYRTPPINNSQSRNAQNVIRSQIAPTMMYPAVSINTTSNSVKQLLLTSYAGPVRKNPFPPKNPQEPLPIRK